MDQTYLLLSVILAPLAGALLLALAPSRFASWVGLGFSMLTLILTGVLGWNASQAPGGEWAVFAAFPWSGMPRFDVTFTFGLDGISLFLLLLTALLFPLLIVYEWSRKKTQAKLYYSMLLLMEAGLMGYFLALDMLLFYVFFELVLIPGSFFIGIWGGFQREKAAIRFFLYTLVGSLLMLVAILCMGLNAGFDGFTSDYFKIREAGFDAPLEVATWLFLAFALSFGIKTPIFPFHAWQPLAYAEASTTGSVIFGALLSKMGVYGFVRFVLPFFPNTASHFAAPIAILAVISIIYGAWQAIIQQNLKRLVAFASLSHLGFIVMGIFALNDTALGGAVFQMTAHGIATAAMFLLIDMLYQRRGSYEITDYRGAAREMPAFALLFMIAVLATVGLPGLSGFVGEFYILTGSFVSNRFGSALVIIAAFSLILAAVYLLNMFRKVMFGPSDAEATTRKDLTRTEWIAVAPLAILMLWLGLQASPLLQRIRPDALQALPEEVPACCPELSPEDPS